MPDILVLQYGDITILPDSKELDIGTCRAEYGSD